MNLRLDRLFYLLSNIRHVPRFLSDYVHFRRKVHGWDCRLFDLLPMLSDRTPVMEFDAHYVYHTAWAARVLKELSPEEHIDISSSIMFCGIVSAFMKTKHYDYRTPYVDLPGLTCGSQDLFNLSFDDCSIQSLSCMHVIEHVGLGRYGDPINSKGDLFAANELQRVLARGGNLLLVVPVAQRARIRFNGHRIYDVAKVRSLFDGLQLTEFSFLNDSTSNKFTRHASDLDVQGSNYGCGCFVFRKPLTARSV